MSGLRFSGPAFDTLRAELLSHTLVESCAIGYAHHDRAGGSWVVADAAAVPDDAYEARDRVSAVLKPAFLLGVANRSRATGMAVVFMHTHPESAGHPRFSPIDDAGEQELASYFGRRGAPVPHLAMVIGPEGCRARRIADGGEIEAWSVGNRLDLLSPPPSGGILERDERQVRAFGEPGQRLLRRLRFAVIGAGGTGSLTCQLLAHLGASHVMVIDPQLVEATNLNRLVGGTPADVGKAKVEVARRMMHAINPDMDIAAVVGDVVDEEVARLLPAYDFMLLCTDSHASRMVANQIAYQHLVPVIDMGVSITVAAGTISHITGRVQMLAPGLPCLTCCGALDAEQIRREMQTAEQRAIDPYVHGEHEPEPAVISINSTVTSLAATMLLGAVTPVPSRPRQLTYDGIRGRTKELAAPRCSNCVVCSPLGSLTKADSWNLPVRRRSDW